MSYDPFLKYHLVKAIAEVAKKQPDGFTAADVWAHVDGNPGYPSNLRAEAAECRAIAQAFAVARRPERRICVPKNPPQFFGGDKVCNTRPQRVWVACSA